MPRVTKHHVLFNMPQLAEHYLKKQPQLMYKTTIPGTLKIEEDNLHASLRILRRIWFFSNEAFQKFLSSSLQHDAFKKVPVEWLWKSMYQNTTLCEVRKFNILKAGVTPLYTANCQKKHHLQE